MKHISLRKAIDGKCKDCTYDTADKGSWRQQVAACTINSCTLHPVRPVSKTTKLPLSLLNYWEIKPEDLDDRARKIVKY